MAHVAVAPSAQRSIVAYSTGVLPARMPVKCALPQAPDHPDIGGAELASAVQSEARNERSRRLHPIGNFLEIRLHPELVQQRGGLVGYAIGLRTLDQSFNVDSSGSASAAA
jgi:hypothetical protein